MAEEKLLKLAERYKESIFTKLSELAASRIERIDRADLEGKTTEEVLSLIYLQGVAEALDAFDITALQVAADEGDDAPFEA